MFERRLSRFLTELEYLYHHAMWRTRNAVAEDERKNAEFIADLCGYLFHSLAELGLNPNWDWDGEVRDLTGASAPSAWQSLEAGLRETDEFAVPRRHAEGRTVPQSRFKDAVGLRATVPHPRGHALVERRGEGSENADIACLTFVADTALFLRGNGRRTPHRPSGF